MANGEIVAVNFKYLILLPVAMYCSDSWGHILLNLNSPCRNVCMHATKLYVCLLLEQQYTEWEAFALVCLNMRLKAFLHPWASPLPAQHQIDDVLIITATRSLTPWLSLPDIGCGAQLRLEPSDFWHFHFRKTLIRLLLRNNNLVSVLSEFLPNLKKYFTILA